MTSVEIEPRRMVQTGAIIKPPVVVKFPPCPNMIATATLVDSHRSPVPESDQLQGVRRVEGRRMIDDGSNIFVFQDLAVPQPGNYFIHFKFFYVLFDTGEQFLISGIYSGRMEVLNRRFAPTRLSTYLIPLPYYYGIVSL